MYAPQDFKTHQSNHLVRGSLHEYGMKFQYQDHFHNLTKTFDATIEQFIKHADCLTLAHQTSTQQESVHEMAATTHHATSRNIVDGFCEYHRRFLYSLCILLVPFFSLSRYPLLPQFLSTSYYPSLTGATQAIQRSE